jgi:hypothetical protein
VTSNSIKTAAVAATTDSAYRKAKEAPAPKIALTGIVVLTESMHSAGSHSYDVDFRKIYAS